MILCLVGASYMAHAQRKLSLDSCRAMALQGNKQLTLAKLNQDVARDVKKAARTHYLPKVDALGGYSYMSKEVSILNDDQKSALSNLGTNLTGAIGQNIQQGMGNMPPGLWTALGNMGFTPEAIQQHIGNGLSQFGSLLDAGGQRVVNAFRTDTRNMFA